MRRSGVGERCTAGKAIRRYHELFCISDVSGRGDSVASLSAVGFTALIMHKASSTLFLDSGRYVPDSARTTPQCLDDPAADFHSMPKATLARSLHYSTHQLHPLSRRTLLHAKHHVKSRRHDKLAFFADFLLRNVWSDCPGGLHSKMARPTFLLPLNRLLSASPLVSVIMYCNAIRSHHATNSPMSMLLAAVSGPVQEGARMS